VPAGPVTAMVTAPDAVGSGTVAVISVSLTIDHVSAHASPKLSPVAPENPLAIFPIEHERV